MGRHRVVAGEAFLHKKVVDDGLASEADLVRSAAMPPLLERVATLLGIGGCVSGERDSSVLHLVPFQSCRGTGSEVLRDVRSQALVIRQRHRDDVIVTFGDDVGVEGHVRLFFSNGERKRPDFDTLFPLNIRRVLLKDVLVMVNLHVLFVFTLTP